MKKLTILTVICFFSTGCVTPTDLRTSGVLNASDQRLAINISSLVQTNCTHHRYYPGSDQKTTGDNKFSQTPSVKRMYISESGWIKAEIHANGVWDSVYYLQNSGTLICGEQSWQRHRDSSSIAFSEIGGTSKYLPVATTPASTNTQTPKKNIGEYIRPIAVQWESYPKLISGLVTISESGARGRIRALLPAGEGECGGTYEVQDLKLGKWAVSCTNGLAATGSLELHGANKGATGAGLDTKGNKVSFTVGASN